MPKVRNPTPPRAVARPSPEGTHIEVGCGKKKPSFRWVPGWVVTENGRDTVPMTRQAARDLARRINEEP